MQYGSRRRGALRRLFFLHASALLVASQAFGQTEPVQEATPVRILERRLRLSRDAVGDYRVIESLSVQIGINSGAPDSMEPIPLIRLPAGADRVRGLGGDVMSRQVIFRSNTVALSGPFARREVQFAFTYLLASSATSLALSAVQAVATLIVEVDRGGLDVRPDPALNRGADGGSPSRPYRTYVADDLPPDATLTLELVASRVDARQRFAVLSFTALLVLVAAAWVWRRR